MGAQIDGLSNLDAKSADRLPEPGDGAELIQGESHVGTDRAPSANDQNRRDGGAKGSWTLNRHCSCGGTLAAQPVQKKRSRHRPKPVHEVSYFCRTCKKQMVIPSLQLQTRRCIRAAVCAIFLCVFGFLLFQEMRRNYALYFIAATAVISGLWALGCHLSLQAFLQGARNRRRYPVEEVAESA